MAENSVRIGLIGAGRIGKVHADSIVTRVNGAELAAIADVYVPAAEELAAKFNVTQVTENYGEILGDDSIKIVAICSATDTHAQIIQEAAAAGKHIFCEKPIDHSLEKIDTALAAVEAAGVKFLVGFNRRFDPSFAKVRELVATGKIGEPHLLRITSRDPAPPPIDYIKVSGGIFLDMTIHDFDIARFLIGSEVEEIFAAGAVMVDPAIGAVGDLDTVIITLKFENGVIGTIDNSRQAVYGYDQRVEVFGSAGMAAAGNQKPDTHEFSTADGVHFAKPLHFFLERYMDAYVAEMEAFVECVLNDRPSPIPAEAGRMAVVMGLAARKSWEQNRPVRLSEIS